MAISIQDDNNVTVKTKIRTVRDIVIGQCLTKTATNVVPTGAAPNMDCSLGDDWTYTPAEANTISATNIQPNQLVTILYLTSGASSYTSTFGAGFASTGTLATGVTTARYFLMQFKANAAGTMLLEQSRTTAYA